MYNIVQHRWKQTLWRCSPRKFNKRCYLKANNVSYTWNGQKPLPQILYTKIINNVWRLITFFLLEDEDRFLSLDMSRYFFLLHYIIIFRMNINNWRRYRKIHIKSGIERGRTVNRWRKWCGCWNTSRQTSSSERRCVLSWIRLL